MQDHKKEIDKIENDFKNGNISLDDVIIECQKVLTKCRIELQ